MKKPGLYLHIPFCRTKCPYCGFFSVPSARIIPRWLNALEKEIIHYSDRFHTFDSLYLGGGTPTVLPMDAIERIMGLLRSHLSISNDLETTIEANPQDLCQENTSALKELGFNRVNVGVQSFDDSVLRFLGREHSADEAEAAIENLRSAGIGNIGIDLIYGIPYQPLDAWKKTAKHAIALRPEHVSCYHLTFEKGTLFEKKRQKGEIDPIDEEMERVFFLETSRLLEENGYLHYEISNFARENRYRSWHNMKYWNHVPYLGLGPSAHSFQGSRRWWNFRSVRKYCEVLEQGRAPVEGHEDLTDEQLTLEMIALGLRTITGVELGAVSHAPEQKEALSMLEDGGFLMIKNGMAIPTKKGFLVADRLPLYFMPQTS